jgi:threonine dehydrogenase-like Zn-dependent dehydrogenase
MRPPCSVSHAVSRNLPGNGQKVVVLGAGIIGLLVIAALRLLGFSGTEVSVARYPFQEVKAIQLGADVVVRDPVRDSLYERVAESTGGTLFKPIVGKRVVFGNNGADLIFDCVGAEETFDDSLHLVRSNGKIVVVGQSYAKTRRVDWAAQLFKEVKVVGASLYGIETYGGRPIHAFELALKLFKENPGPLSDLLTHTFTIEDYRITFACTLNKGKNRSIKTAFLFFPCDRAARTSRYIHAGQERP